MNYTLKPYQFPDKYEFVGNELCDIYVQFSNNSTSKRYSLGIKYDQYIVAVPVSLSPLNNPMKQLQSKYQIKVIDKRNHVSLGCWSSIYNNRVPYTRNLVVYKAWIDVYKIPLQQWNLLVAPPVTLKQLQHHPHSHYDHEEL